MRIWRSFLRVNASVSAELDRSLKAEAELTLDDYEVLVHLSESPEQRLRMTELSDRLLHSQSRLTQRVDRLVRRGLVRREKCPEDRRGTFACLTTEGFALLEEVSQVHVRDVRRVLIDLIEPDERAVVAAVFARIANAADRAGT